MLRLRVSLCLVVVVGLAGCAASNATPLWTFLPVNIPPLATGALPPPSPTAAADTIGLSEWKVDVASTIAQGTSTFTISNIGTIPHELLIFKSDLAPSAYPVNAAGDIVEDGAGINLLSDGDNIDPGGSQARTVDLAPGTYLFVCNIPGHFKAGMFTVVTVGP